MSEGYAALFLSAFLAASILPFSSEALLGGMMVSDRFDQVWLLVVASTGNTLGAVVNWALGRFFIHFRDHRWFPVKATELERATNGFNRYGSWSLLFAWVPVVGDPLTLVAGILQVPLVTFLVLVAIGKTARYAAVIGIIDLF